MYKRQVVSFVVLLAATLNFGFFIGDIGDPDLHRPWELYAAVIVNVIALVLKFGDRTQVGAFHLATSLVAVLQLAAAAGFLVYFDAQGDLPRTHMSTIVSLSVSYTHLDVYKRQYLCRRVSRAPLGIGEDHWVSVGTLDLDAHVRRTTCPAPGDDQALMDHVLQLTQKPLDRSLQLWELWYVEGTADDRTALVMRGHHALTVGMGFMKLYASLFDPRPTARPSVAPCLLYPSRCV